MLQTWLDQLLNSPWGPFAVILGAAGLLILLAYGLYQLNVYLIKRGTHPALVELLNKAIALAWQASEQAIDAGMDRLHGFDKKSIANGLYKTGGDLLVHLQLRYLPGSVDLRKFITFEQFSDFVQDRFDQVTDGLQDILNQMEEQGPPVVPQAEVLPVKRGPNAWGNVGREH